LDQWGDPEDISLNAFPKASGDGVGFRSNALSGGERNRMFLNTGDNFKDMTLVSGVDFREDGRGFVLFDYDRDGWLDMGISSPNAPRFRIVKNRMADFQDAKNGFIEVSLIGGQDSATPTTEWSSRDGFGSKVIATIGETKRMFQLNCGEGLSVQNAARIHIGIGTASKVDKLEVLWLSGKTTVRENVESGERITLREKPGE